MNVIKDFRGEYYFLSNFYPNPPIKIGPLSVFYDGITYPSTEHAYQAAKTLDINERIKISKLQTCGMAKKAGQKLIIREDWDQVKNHVMYDVCKIKFSVPYFKLKLLATKDAYLEEGNAWHDNYWGVCYCGKCPEHNKQPKENQNHLGIILMKIRDELS